MVLRQKSHINLDLWFLDQAKTEVGRDGEGLGNNPSAPGGRCSPGGQGPSCFAQVESLSQLFAPPSALTFCPGIIGMITKSLHI